MLLLGGMWLSTGLMSGRAGLRSLCCLRATATSVACELGPWTRKVPLAKEVMVSFGRIIDILWIFRR